MDSKKTRQQPVRKVDECQSFACAIQGCLQKNNFDQDKCLQVIEQMLDCCELNMKENYPSCDGFKFNLMKRQKERDRQSNKTNDKSKA